jgi:hypothetical protein
MGTCVNVVMDDEMIPRQHSVQSGAGWMAWLCCIVIFFTQFPERCIWRCVIIPQIWGKGGESAGSAKIRSAWWCC